MIIKIISPNKKDFYIIDLKKDYENKNFQLKTTFENYKNFENNYLKHLQINKQYNLLDYIILNK